MFNLWKKMDNDRQLIQALWRVIMALGGMIVLLSIGWMSAPSRLTVYIPPDVSNGQTVKPNVIPNEVIYAFAFEIFTALNTWSQDGEDDYPAAIKNYRYYLTPHFQSILLADEKTRQADGSLSRIRLMTGYSGMGYTAGTVKMIAKNVWEVDMTLKLVETVGGETVKDIVVDYPLRVVRVNEATTLNPWGLALDGFTREPVRTNVAV